MENNYRLALILKHLSKVRLIQFQKNISHKLNPGEYSKGSNKIFPYDKNKHTLHQMNNFENVKSLSRENTNELRIVFSNQYVSYPLPPRFFTSLCHEFPVEVSPFQEQFLGQISPLNLMPGYRILQKTFGSTGTPNIFEDAVNP